jgi:hypothetical protein
VLVVLRAATGMGSKVASSSRGARGIWATRTASPRAGPSIGSAIVVRRSG